MRNNWKKRMQTLGVVLVWVLLWEALALLVRNPFLLVTPGEAIATLFGLLGTESFWISILGSVLRIGSGFLLGLLFSIVCAVSAYKNRIVELFLSPAITFMKTVPVVSFVVLFLIWWGAENLAVGICFMVVFPGIYIQMLEGLKSVPTDMKEVSRVSRFTAKTAFFYLYRPYLRPFFMGGLKLTLGMCWKAGVAAEVIGMSARSIGERLYMAKISLATGEIVAWTIVIVIISVVFEKLMLLLARWFFGLQVGCTVRNYVEKPQGIQIKEVFKAYGDNRIFEGFSANYLPGEKMLLNWESGKGKTTLFRLISGLESVDLGKTETPGRLAYLFQENRLMESLSAVKNVEMVTGSRQKAESELAYFFTEEEMNRPVSELSGGMKRKVALVRAMCMPADFVLLDEPLAGLDEENRKRVRDYIDKESRGRGILIASHVDHEEFEAVSEK